MERLPNHPWTPKKLIEADLRRPARLVIKIRDEIDPQFRIATPKSRYRIAIELLLKSHLATRCRESRH